MGRAVVKTDMRPLQTVMSRFWAKIGRPKITFSAIRSPFGMGILADSDARHTDAVSSKTSPKEALRCLTIQIQTSTALMGSRPADCLSHWDLSSSSLSFWQHSDRVQQVMARLGRYCLATQQRQQSNNRQQQCPSRNNTSLVSSGTKTCLVHPLTPLTALGRRLLASAFFACAPNKRACPC